MSRHTLPSRAPVTHSPARSRQLARIEGDAATNDTLTIQLMRLTDGRLRVSIEGVVIGEAADHRGALRLVESHPVFMVEAPIGGPVVSGGETFKEAVRRTLGSGALSSDSIVTDVSDPRAEQIARMEGRL